MRHARRDAHLSRLPLSLLRSVVGIGGCLSRVEADGAQYLETAQPRSPSKFS
jgi:hypothetical protein